MKNIIEEYILLNYRFTINSDGWCVFDKQLGVLLTLRSFIKDMNKVFPNMCVDDHCNSWWDANISINTKKIDDYFSRLKLVQSYRWSEAWDVMDGNKRFKLSDLTDILPAHFNTLGIKKLYYSWYEEERYKETEKLINNL